MNRLLCLWLSVLLLGFSGSLFAQTSLTTGSLIFVGYNASDDQTNGNNSNEKFSFVLLKNVAAGTKIYFTDYGWLTGGGFQKKWVAGPENGGSGTGSKNDGIISWTASTSVAAGTQIVIRPKYQMGANIGTVACEESVAETIAGQSYCMDLQDTGLSPDGESGGDELFAYQATSARATPTVLAGIRMSAPWNSGLTNAEYTPSRSALPPTLTNNSVNASLNTYTTAFSDNFRALSIYNCQTNTGFPRTIRNAVNSATVTSSSSDPNNWDIPNEGTGCSGYLYQPNDPFCPQGSIPAGFDLPIACTFTVYELKIVSQPVSTTVCSYQSATFSVDSRITTAPVAQDANTTYKWQYSTDNVTWTDVPNSGVYSGVTSKTLTISNTTGLNNRRFRAIVAEPIEPSSVTSTTALLTVNNPPQNLALAASGPLTCVTLSVNLTASSSTGGTTYAFTGPGGPIATAPGTNVIPTSQEGAYSIVGTTPQGCTATTGTTVIKDITPPANVGLSVSGPLTCATPTVTLTGTASATSTIGYAFKGSQGPIASSGNQANVSQEGSYTVTATASANGCSATATTGVTSDTVAPTATLMASNTISCAQPTVTLTAGAGQGYTYVFRNTGGVVPSNGNQAVVTVAGTYTVVVTGPNGCTASTTTTVTGNSNPLSVNLSASGVITCAAPTVTLTATPISGATYVFSAGAAQPGGPSSNTATVTAAGTYTVTVSDANGCSGSATVGVTGSSAPLSINLTTSSNISCATPTVTLTATPASGATYVFSAGAAQPGGPSSNTATVTSAGTYTVTVSDTNGCSGSATVGVTGSSTPITVNLSASSAISCATPTVTLTATPVSGATYVFSAGAAQVGGSTGNTATVTAAGTYTVTATNANACSASATVEVTGSVSSIPVNLSPSGVITCAAPTVTLTATPVSGATYVFSAGAAQVGGSTGNTATVTAAGTYTVTVSDANGCSGSATVGVTGSSAPLSINLTASSNISCTTPTVTLTATPVSGATYVFSAGAAQVGGSTGNTATVTAAGTYTVTVGDANGCSGSATVGVTGSSTPPTVNLSANGAITCAAPTVTLTATPISGATYIFSAGAAQVGGSTGNTATVTAAGTYTVTVSDVNGCSGSATVGVTGSSAPLSINLTASGSINCTTPTVTLTATPVSGATYVFSAGAAQPGGPSSNTATVSSAGTYTVTATNAGGCSGSATTGVTGVVTPLIINLTASSNINCTTPTVTLTATPVSGATYVFSAGAAQPGGPSSNTATVTSAGTYTVTVSNALGCSGSATVGVTGSSTPPSVSLNANGSISSTTPTITLTATPISGATYVFSAGASQPGGPSSNTATVTSAGTYTVTVTGTNACTATASVSVSTVATPTGSLTACRNGRLVLTTARPASRYEWYKNGQTAANKLSDVASIQVGTTTASLTLVSVQTNATYYVKEIQANGSFTWTGPFSLTVDTRCNARLAQEEPSSALSIELMPNPVVGGQLQAVVRGAAQQRLSVRLTDMRGQAVTQQQWMQAEAAQVVRWDISQQPAGLYLLQAQTEQGQVTVRVLHR